MRKYVFISAGGILGAIARYMIENIHIYRYNENIPLNTLLINVAGSFLLAFILTSAFEARSFEADIRNGLTTGFLGAFTTFSTMCKESAGLLKAGAYFSAVSYITVSVVLGLAAAYFGIVLAGEIARLVKKEDVELESEVNTIEGEAD